MIAVAMRIVFSRKGLDSSNEGGRGRSPLLEDGSLLSIPIPESVDVEGISYADISAGAHGTYADVMTALGIDVRRMPHLDPDIAADMRPRGHGWLGMFGQANAAQSHLRNQHIGAGDLIVFFGLFQRVHQQGGRLVWTGSPFQAIWGYLQVGVVWDWRACQSAPAWARQHPHVHHGHRYEQSSVYVARPELALAATRTALPGFARLRWHDGLRLTALDATPSVWRVPASMWPGNSDPTLTYHGNRARWTRDNDALLLRTVGRGQEFVMPSTAPVERWLATLFERGVSG